MARDTKGSPEKRKATVFLPKYGSAAKLFRMWHLTEVLNTLFVGLEMLNAEGFADKLNLD